MSKVGTQQNNKGDSIREVALIISKRSKLKKERLFLDSPFIVKQDTGIDH